MLQEIGNPSSDYVKTPDIVFTDIFEIFLDNKRKAIIKHVGGDHSPDSTVIHLPNENIVFIGDCLAPAIDTKNIHYTKTNFIKLLDTLIALNANEYYESHVLEPIPLEELVILREYILEQIDKQGILYNTLQREYFPKTHTNKLIDGILECWDMFIKNTL